MQRLALVGLFSAMAVSTTMAADLRTPVTKAPPMAAVMAHNWTGCYIGGNLGGKWASSSDDVALGATPATVAVRSNFARETSGTFIGGGQLGCNLQTGNWVFGFEGDVDWQRWSHSRRQLVTLSPLVAGDIFDVRSDWQASARGRLGYAWDRWLLYVTGGAAFTNVIVGANFPVFVGAVTFPATIASESKTLFGPTVGAGLEYALSNNWSVGLEGRYSWYGTHTFNSGLVAAAINPAGGFFFAPATQSVRVETLEVTARLNYKFDWGGAPIAARY